MKNKSPAIEHYFVAFTPREDIPSVSLILFKTLLTITLWRRMARTRAQLRHLTDDELCDIGISRAEAEIEARRPFYDCG